MPRSWGPTTGPRSPHPSHWIPDSFTSTLSPRSCFDCWTPTFQALGPLPPTTGSWIPKSQPTGFWLLKPQMWGPTAQQAGPGSCSCWSPDSRPQSPRPVLPGTGSHALDPPSRSPKAKHSTRIPRPHPRHTLQPTTAQDPTDQGALGSPAPSSREPRGLSHVLM